MTAEPVPHPTSKKESWRAYVATDTRPFAGAKRYQPRSGHPDWPRLMREADAIVAEVLPTLAQPQRGLPEVTRRAKSYATAARGYLENRRRARAGREDLLPLYFIWTTLRACNFRCTYCDDHRGQKYPDLPLKGALDTARGKRLLEVMRTRATSVYFAGGEPTARKDLPVLTRHARDLAYYPVVVNTNGSLVERNLRKPEWRTWLADTDLIVVSLDGLNLERLARLWVTDAPQDVLRNLLVLRALAGPMRFRLTVNCVMEPGQTDEALDVLDLAGDLGITYAFVPMNVGPRIADGFHGDPGYERFAETILARKRAGQPMMGSLRLNERLVRSAPISCRNTLKPHVDFDGRLFWPCKGTVNVPPAMVDVLAFDHVDDVWAHGAKLIDPTHFHGPAPDQCGGDCNWAQNYSVDAYTHGLLHPLSLLGEIADFVRSR